MELFRETERLLLSVGYEGFTVSLLADSLNISRAAIYKYYANKEEIIVDFMIDSMTKIINEIRSINVEASFTEQLEELLAIIFKSKDIHQILGMAHIINDQGDEQLILKKTLLEQLHMSMYLPMQKMIEKGKKEGLLSIDLPNELIIGFIFQSMAIPNFTHIPKEIFLESIKKMICHGIYKF